MFLQFAVLKVIIFIHFEVERHYEIKRTDVYKVIKYLKEIRLLDFDRLLTR